MQMLIQNLTDAIPIAASNGCSVFQFRNETGEGTITVYEAFPGVILAYNDFHVRYYDSNYLPAGNVFCVDFCREGRLEYKASNNAYSYVEAGDLKMDCRLTHTGRFELPLAHYHGAMVCFDVEIAEQSIQDEIKNFPVDLKVLQKKYCPDAYPMVLHKLDSIAHIFEELYKVPEKIKRPYFKIKVLELLLYLDAVEIPEQSEGKPYFYKTQVEKVRAIHQFLMEHVDENYTQEELSALFDIPLTPMKKCFKSIFGNTIGGWLLEYRMNQAAVMLKTKQDLSVAEIGGAVGYDSPSKFALAFRKIMGLSPTEYRKRSH